MAYSCGAVITLLITAVNTAFSPWLGEKLSQDRYEEIRKVSKYYILLFIFGTCGIMLLTPELLMLMGGKSYNEAIYVMPPVAFGCVCQFLYTMYVNVEQFKKKTLGMAFASVTAALSNYILNSIFIPRYGYIAAAYTTLVSFGISLFIHMLLVRHIGLQCVYPTKVIFLALGFMSVFSVLIHILYKTRVVRYSIFTVYIAVLVYVALKYRHIIIKIWKKKT